MTLTLEQISSLAPAHFENQRSSRYRADEQAVASSALTPDDFALVQDLYGMLGELEELAAAEPPSDEVADLVAFVARHDIEGLLYRVRRLGAESGADPRVASAVHDIRGGALTTIFVRLTRLPRAPQRPDTRRALFLAARDHRKMMRNVVLDLDAAGRARDLAFLPHSLGDFSRALREFTGLVRDERVVVEVDCPADAVIAESCVEVSAMDRVAYNLLNNAVRHADRPSISVWLRILEHDLRVIIANDVAPEQHAVVAASLAGDAAALYGSFTTTGSGHGLRIVSDLVGRAYGVASTDALVKGGYVGARLVGGAFVTWFHWPLAGA